MKKLKRIGRTGRDESRREGPPDAHEEKYPQEGVKVYLKRLCCIQRNKKERGRARRGKGCKKALMMQSSQTWGRKERRILFYEKTDRGGQKGKIRRSSSSTPKEGIAGGKKGDQKRKVKSTLKGEAFSQKKYEEPSRLLGMSTRACEKACKDTCWSRANQ